MFSAKMQQPYDCKKLFKNNNRYLCINYTVKNEYDKVLYVTPAWEGSFFWMRQDDSLRVQLQLNTIIH